MELHSDYAPAERASSQVVQQQFKNIKESSFYTELLNYLPVIIVVFNSKRQIVLGNDYFFNLLKEPDASNILGKRYGEIFGCVNAFKNEGGCGTSIHCRVCNLVNAFLETFNTGRTVKSEVRLTVNKNDEIDALDYEIVSKRITNGGEQYVVANLVDISEKKFKERMEKTFFHDIMNKVGSVYSISELLTNSKLEGEEKELIKLIFEASEEMVNEIKFQQSIINAQNQQFEPYKMEFDIVRMVNHIARANMMQWKEKMVTVLVESDLKSSKIVSDEVILNRIITNLVKNAVEASSLNDVVKIHLQVINNHYVISVHNAYYIPENIQKQIFQRSFSTKGSNRGIGTFSIKLFVENYLNGKVYFTSEQEKGTTFVVEIPVEKSV